VNSSRVHKPAIVPDLYVHPQYGHDDISQLLPPHAQKLPVLRRAPPTPRLAPDAHGNGGSHAQHDHDGVEGEDGSVAGSIDEVLQGLGDGEVDARRADGEDYDDLAGDLYVNKWLGRSNSNKDNPVIGWSLDLRQGSSPSHTQSRYYTR
jgi:hypothetical protein